MTGKNRKELVVSAIENGTVIDHIPSKSVFQVMKILGLDHVENQILFGTNLESGKFGKKGIIKIRNKYFESKEVNKIALVAPSATLIEIKNYDVISKKQVDKPERIVGMVKCVNPNCITNHENITTRFEIVYENSEELKLVCHYCGKYTKKENMVFI
jgi:aspartate carbamoyltransferase regulatory subunit